MDSPSLLSVHSGVDEGDHDVPRALGRLQPLVVVRQSPRVHQHPALLRPRNSAVVPLSIELRIAFLFQCCNTVFPAYSDTLGTREKCHCREFPTQDANGCQKSVAPKISENFEFFNEILTHFECTKCHKSMPTPLGVQVGRPG